jgi:hypothetical protein
MNDTAASQPRLRVTVLDRPKGGFDLWLDALAINADGDTQPEAIVDLVEECRDLIAAWESDARLRQASNSQRRGALIVALASLSDDEIAARFDLQRGDGDEHLDAQPLGN